MSESQTESHIQRFPKPFLSTGGGETGDLFRSIDWAKHPLGPCESWPESLKTMLSVLFYSRHPMFIWWGPDLYQFYNDAYQVCFGETKRPTAMGQKGKDCWTEIWHIIWPQIKNVMELGKASWNVDQLIPIFRNNHIEEVYWTYGYSPIFLSNGKIGGTFVVCTETTPEVVAKKDLVDVLESMNDAFLSVDKYWNILRVNRHYERMTGLLREDQLGKNFLELSFPTQAEQNGLHWSHYHKAMKERVHVYFEDYNNLRKVWTAVYVYPKADGGLAVFYTDITEAKKSEKALKEAIEARDVFLGIASHELKTPLTSLKLQSQMSKRILDGRGPASLTPENIEKLINTSISQADRLSRLVEDMLDVSQIASGKLSINIENMDLSALVLDTLNRFSPQLEEAKCEVSTRVEPHLSLKGDPFRFEQVLTNLITNAIKYASGKPIHVSLLKNSKAIELKFRDHGSGIPKDKLSRVFERFERLVSPKEVSGLGLGLHISREIVKAHSGEIHVESEVGQGSEFLITIPLPK